MTRQKSILDSPQTQLPVNAPAPSPHPVIRTQCHRVVVSTRNSNTLLARQLRDVNGPSVLLVVSLAKLVNNNDNRSVTSTTSDLGVQIEVQLGFQLGVQLFN